MDNTNGGPAVPINGDVPADGQYRIVDDDVVEQWSTWAGFWDVAYQAKDKADAHVWVEAHTTPGTNTQGHNEPGYTVTAEFCGWPEPRAIVRYQGVRVSSHDTRDSALAAVKDRGGARPVMFRGDHELPYGSQVQGRDLTYDEIGRRFLGLTALAYRLTPEQVQQRRDGTGPSSGFPYEFQVYAPDSPATNWTAFYTEDALRAWAAAYDITIEQDTIEPGTQFSLRMPDSLDNVLPLAQHSEVAK